MKVTASLVLYCNPPHVFEGAVRSVIESDADVVISIVDNSPVPLTSDLFSHRRVRYIHAGANLGFGAGHNKAFSGVADQSDVHFIINPDVTFGPAVLGALENVFAHHSEVSAAMPSIHDEMDRPQHLCKALPTPIDLIARRFIPIARIRRAINANYELRGLPTKGLIDIPSLSGCFLGVRSSMFARVGGFDERFFMYMEDVDLVRRLGDQGRTVYVPAAKIHHGHARSSYRFGKLMFVHVRSAVSYFGKWGWFRDPVRTTRNAAARRLVNTS